MLGVERGTAERLSNEPDVRKQRESAFVRRASRRESWTPFLNTEGVDLPIRKPSGFRPNRSPNGEMSDKQRPHPGRRYLELRRTDDHKFICNPTADGK